ncbi:hypothetical protein BpHYR1_021263 [Brachionus plicatilis]|uniref:Uncharacterized protein n=1 Tax=Brachionus plicatilis TaxID=10195 RepID=A0A3M7SBW5_BRAPC|nr:hypothetical protein BpHYR1_021263 [Brachionus plicatilis]
MLEKGQAVWMMKHQIVADYLNTVVSSSIRGYLPQSVQNISLCSDLGSRTTPLGFQLKNFWTLFLAILN